MTSEIWKPVVGYEGIYEVSNAGNVKRIWAPKNNQHCLGRVLAGDIGGGYRRVGLYRDGKGERVAIHHLVLEAFIGPMPSGKEQANHKNGVKTDNRPENLEYVTRSENALHACRILNTHRQKGSLHGRSKLTEEQVTEIRALRKCGSPLKDIADRFGVCLATVSMICLHRKWKHNIVEGDIPLKPHTILSH
jgi:hypothetical protein